jgi:galactokinase
MENFFMNTFELAEKISDGIYDHQFEALYGGSVKEQRKRYFKAIQEFKSVFGDSDELRVLSVPGRSEVGGNHTDRNNGRVLACAINLDVIAVAAPSGNNTIRIKSEGFDIDVVDLCNLSPVATEKGGSAALVRGVAARLKALGYKIGGFDAYTTSNVLKGSGMSSSAAFEVMTANIISCLFCGGSIDPVVMAQAGKYAECEFFGKPCGLMDQTACAVGGFITIDFKDTEKPVIEKLDFDFVKTGYSLCIIDTAGNHADLSDEYAAIRYEMASVARFLGHQTLRECDESEFYSNIGQIREKLGDRAVLRAIHFFGDNARVLDEVAALKAGDFDAFLSYVTASGRSSFMYLQNIFSLKNPSSQGLGLALALAERLLAGAGAWRVHGGGFAGTIQAFVPQEKLETFTSTMDGIFGKNACHKLMVRSSGAYSFS